MEATPRPRAAVPGQVSRRCRGGDNSLLYRLRSRPCHIKAPANVDPSQSCAKAPDCCRSTRMVGAEQRYSARTGQNKANLSCKPVLLLETV